MAAAKHNWSTVETKLLLEILKELRIVERLDGRKARNNELFKQVFEKFNEAGIHRTIDQIKNRWKSLKAAYYKAKTQNNKSGSDPATFPFYEVMDDLMGGRPLANMADHGVDIGFQDNSNDGEESAPGADVTPEDSILGDEDNNVQDTEESSNQQTSEEDCSSHTTTVPRAAKKRPSPKASSGYAKVMRTWSTEQRSFQERMQESQHVWMEQQQERSQQREERVLSRFQEEISRSNERLMGQLFEGLRAVFPQPYQAAPAFQHPAPAFQHPAFQHPHPQLQPQQPYPGPSQNNQDGSGTYSSDYSLHDMG